MTPARPAWSRDSAVLRLDAPERPLLLDPGWIFGASTGAGVRVAVIDSGIEADHPLLHDRVDVQAGVEFQVGPTGRVIRRDGAHRDVYGHGTACAGIIHALAPDATITSVRVLDEGLRGRAAAFHAGLQWAVEEEFDVINLSLGAARREWALAFHDVCDRGYFTNSFIVTAANNVARDSFPSLYASVTSVAANTATDPLRYHFNPEPPTEFLARGIDVEVPWLDGTTIVTTGNSFAAPHISGFAALIRAEHPDLRPFQIKTALWAASANVRESSPVEWAGRRSTIRHARSPQSPPTPPVVDRDPVAARVAGGPGDPVPVGVPVAPGATPAGDDRAALAGLLGPGWTLGAMVAHSGPVRTWAGDRSGRPVEIHRLVPPPGCRPEEWNRRLRALRVAAGLRHPHLVPVVELRLDERAAVVVTPTPATSLDQREPGPLAPAVALAATVSVLRGVQAGHAAGVVHGRLGPSDAVVDGGGRVQVAGLGLAAALASDGRGTSPAVHRSRWRHLAPEHLDGRPIGPHTDVHGAGLVAYELLCGEPAWDPVADLGSLIRQRIDADPRPLRAVAPWVDADLARLVDRAVAAEPTQRPRSAVAFARQLEEAAHRWLGPSWAASQPYLLEAGAVPTAAGRGSGGPPPLPA